jgi:PAS domain S-box-containing protein
LSFFCSRGLSIFNGAHHFDKTEVLLILASILSATRSFYFNFLKYLNNIIRIGFFLAFVFGSVPDYAFSNRKHINREWQDWFTGDMMVRNTSNRVLILDVVRFPSQGAFQISTVTAGARASSAIRLCRIEDQGGKAISNTREVNSSSDRGYMAFWVALTLIFLLGTLYLLFQIRKTQAITLQVQRVRGDLMTLFNNSPCGYHSIDERGFLININNTLLHWLGYEREEIVGKLKFVDMVENPAEDLSERISTLGTGSHSVKLNLIKKNRDSFPVMLGVVHTGDLTKDSTKKLFSTIDNRECRDAMERIKNLDQELEAFSYSISHDLRAPLRSIDGYSRILEEDHAGQLDEEGRRVLNVIMNNARRMGKLIDDLLDFGRLGRKTIQRAHIDMTAMVNSIVHELVSPERDRKIDIAVGDLIPAFADADMIRQVWFNLLENAIKYTGKKDFAVIRVRSYQTAGRAVCYEVKDNGVGFDMKYVPKLFGVFQRLHKIQDFTGTGVGLAIVKRIISRHGGQVWAEGLLNEGATFCFTIPIENENT